MSERMNGRINERIFSSPLIVISSSVSTRICPLTFCPAQKMFSWLPSSKIVSFILRKDICVRYRTTQAISRRNWDITFKTGLVAYRAQNFSHRFYLQSMLTPKTSIYSTTYSDFLNLIISCLWGPLMSFFAFVFRLWNCLQQTFALLWSSYLYQNLIFSWKHFLRRLFPCPPRNPFLTFDRTRHGIWIAQQLMLWALRSGAIEVIRLE